MLAILHELQFAMAALVFSECFIRVLVERKLGTHMRKNPLGEVHPQLSHHSARDAPVTGNLAQYDQALTNLVFDVIFGHFFLKEHIEKRFRPCN